MMPVLVVVILLATTLLLGEKCDNGRERPPAPVPVWTGSGETGPDSTTNQMFISRNGQELFVLTTDESGKKQVSTVRLWNDVAPVVSGGFDEVTPGVWRYRYTVTNQPGATDPIGTWSILLPPEESGERNQSPTGGKPWGGAASISVKAHQSLFLDEHHGRVMRWYHHGEDSRIMPGESLGIFGLDSSLRPGFTTAWFAAGKTVSYGPSWPDETFAKLDWLSDYRWRGRGLIVIGPMFPANAHTGSIRNNFLSGIRCLVATRRLDQNSAFTQQLIQSLKSDEEAAAFAASASPKGDWEVLIHRALRVHFDLAQQKDRTTR